MRPMGVVSQHTDPLVWLTLMNETHVWQALKSAYYAIPESHEFIILDFKGVAWLHLFRLSPNCVIYGGKEYGFINSISIGSRFVNGCFCGVNL